jgi:hypothetical protein
MPQTQPLNTKERKVLELLIELAGGINRPIRFRALRNADFPERVEEIYDEHPDYLDALACRKLEKLRDKGWITMKDAIQTAVQAP